MVYTCVGLRVYIPAPIKMSKTRIQRIRKASNYSQAFVISTPEPVGFIRFPQCCSLGFVAASFTAFDQTVAIEDSMDGALGGWFDHGKITE